MLLKRSPKVILLVEDDDMVRTVIERMLQSGGFQTVCTANGPEALSLLGAMPVDLMLSDVVMPGMTGIELAQAALALRPRLRIVLMSGYCQTKEDVAPLKLIGKPFSHRELLDSLDDALAA